METPEIYSKMMSYLKRLGFKDAMINSYKLDDDKKEITIFFVYNNKECCGGSYVEDSIAANYALVFY